jgi:hypothetical protein
MFCDYTLENMKALARIRSIINSQAKVSDTAIFAILIIENHEQVDESLKLIDSNKVYFMSKEEISKLPLNECFLQYDLTLKKIIRRKLSLTFIGA